MKILLTGKEGQLGFELQRSLAMLGEVHAVDLKECDLANAEAIRQLVREVNPALIVNPAAYTAVDKAEQEPGLAFAVNTEAPRVFGEEAVRLNAWVIHYSTDYVFDGEAQGAYTEADETAPQSVYGLSKRDGEIALRETGARHLILRTSWVVGAHGGNFAKTMLRLAKERESLSVVADQFGAPTSAALLADMTAQLVGRARRDGLSGFPFGLYHLVAGGETHWCDYARFVVQRAIEAGVSLKLTPEDIKPIATADYPTPARRPANSRLDTELFRKTFDLEIPHWQLGVGHVLKQLF